MGEGRSTGRGARPEVVRGVSRALRERQDWGGQPDKVWLIGPRDLWPTQQERPQHREVASTLAFTALVNEVEGLRRQGAELLPLRHRVEELEARERDRGAEARRQMANLDRMVDAIEEPEEPSRPTTVSPELLRALMDFDE